MFFVVNGFEGLQKNKKKGNHSIGSALHKIMSITVNTN